MNLIYGLPPKHIALLESSHNFSGLYFLYQADWKLNMCEIVYFEKKYSKVLVCEEKFVFKNQRYKPTFLAQQILWCFLFYQKMCTLFKKMQFRVCCLKMFRPLKGLHVLF